MRIASPFEYVPRISCEHAWKNQAASGTKTFSQRCEKCGANCIRDKRDGTILEYDVAVAHYNEGGGGKETAE